MIAEKYKAEDRGLDRLGLQIGRRHHERAVVHREQHQSGGDDLAERAEQQPRPERRVRPRHMVAGRGHHHGEEHQRERKAEQEADIGGAPGAERPGQLPLHRVARDLAERSDDGKGNPERGDADHGWESIAASGSHRAGRGCTVNWQDRTRCRVPAAGASVIRAQRAVMAGIAEYRCFVAGCCDDVEATTGSLDGFKRLLRHHHVVDVHVGARGSSGRRTGCRPRRPAR